MFHTHIWFLPLLIFSAAFALAVPIGLYMAVFDGRLRTAGWLRWIERDWTPARKLEAVCAGVHGVQRPDVRFGFAS